MQTTLIDIFNPSKQDLDNALVECNTSYYDYKEKYRMKKELELFFQKETDKIVNDKDETWKKVYTYPANARSKIDEDYREKADLLVELEIQVKCLELSIEQNKMVYYHIKNNMQNNDMQDIQSEIVWSL